MKKETMTSVGAMVAALLAATCCIGPVLFVLFGASFAFLGKLSFMEAFRPYFLGMAGIMVSYSFWKLYLKKSDCACPADIRIRRISRLIFWVSLVVVLLAVFSQTIILWLYS
ncbi:MAG: mercuric transporter MerT family protein [bacterium]|nr:mercuric transporter MerT family protein [bacterium]